MDQLVQIMQSMQDDATQRRASMPSPPRTRLYRQARSAGYGPSRTPGYVKISVPIEALGKEPMPPEVDQAGMQQDENPAAMLARMLSRG